MTGCETPVFWSVCRWVVFLFCFVFLNKRLFLGFFFFLFELSCSLVDLTVTSAVRSFVFPPVSVAVFVCFVKC